ncbi:MAG: hypothetical protein RIR71_696, partial [Actinomycetota bacterium]
MFKQIAACAAAVALVGAGTITASAAETTPVYMETVATGASLKVLASAGDKIGNYYLPGTPDGLGIVPTKAGVKVLMNHEFSVLGTAAGIKRVGGAVTGGATITGLNLDTTAQTIT